MVCYKDNEDWIPYHLCLYQGKLTRVNVLPFMGGLPQNGNFRKANKSVTKYNLV